MFFSFREFSQIGPKIAPKNGPNVYPAPKDGFSLTSAKPISDRLPASGRPAFCRGPASGGVPGRTPYVRIFFEENAHFS